MSKDVTDELVVRLDTNSQHKEKLDITRKGLRVSCYFKIMECYLRIETAEQIKL